MFVCLCKLYTHTNKTLSFFMLLGQSSQIHRLKVQKTEAMSYTQLQALLNYEAKQDLVTSATPLHILHSITLYTATNSFTPSHSKAEVHLFLHLEAQYMNQRLFSVILQKNAPDVRCRIPVHLCSRLQSIFKADIYVDLLKKEL